MAAAIADEKRFRDQADAEFRPKRDDWEQKAMLAIKEGRDDLAKQALVSARASTLSTRHSSSRRGSSIGPRRKSSRIRSAI